MNHRLRWLFLVACLAFSSGAAAAQRLVPGQWQFTMTTAGDTRTVDHCITAEKAAEVNGDSTAGRAAAEKGAQGRCTVDAYDVTGDDVSYTLTCGDRVMRSVTRFNGETSSGSLVTTANGIAVTTAIEARRVGACP